MHPYDELQRWYLKQCDGTWEHAYGVTIQSLDNPGWMLTIDLVDTPLENTPFENYAEAMEDPQGWLECQRKGKRFIGACAPLQLNRLVDRFLAWANESIPLI